MVFACAAGVPLSIVEAFIGKVFSIHLEEKEDQKEHEQDKEA